MLTQKAAINKVKSFAEELKKAGIRLQKVILYGSYSQNRQHQWSDIDVALVADEFTGNGFEDTKYFARINNKKPYIIIEAKTYPSSYYLESDPFIDEIKRTGIEIQI